MKFLNNMKKALVNLMEYFAKLSIYRLRSFAF